VIILLSLTGFAITFSTVFIAFLFMLTGQSPQSVAGIFGQQSAYTQGAKRLSPTAVAGIASAATPQARLLGIAVPTDSLMVYRLDLIADGPSKSGNRIMLMIDQYTGKIVLNSESDFPNIGNTYLSWLTPIHYGTFGGMPTRILALIGGLIPLLLYITGFIIWWPRYKKQTGKVTYVEPKPTKAEQRLDAIRHGTWGRYFGYYFKKGIWYAVLLLVSALVAGALYGLISGILIQPALFSVLYTGICITVNFIIALLAVAVNLLLLAPFGISGRSVYKYFAFSLAFLLIFLPVIVAIARFSKTLF
ncbi:MAG: PepSY-associated TM helix domain-containing protein, partial [Flavihumibacter sp.]